MNIVDLFREHGVEFRVEGEHHHTTRNHVNVDCPHCSPGSGKFRLGWNLKYNYFSCWSCGRVATMSTLVDLTNLSSKELKPLIGEIRQGVYEEEEHIRPTGKLELPKGLGELKPVHKKYLRNRGFQSIVTLEELWNIQGIDYTNPRLAWSIFIPIYADGEVVTWTTRSTGANCKQRYITANAEQEKVNIKQVLYGNHYCNHTVIVMEGPLDVWRVGPGAVALFGLQYSRAQFLEIARYPNRYICLDNEPQAQQVAAKLCSELMMFPGKTSNIVLDAKDAGEASEKEVQKLKRLLV